MSAVHDLLLIVASVLATIAVRKFGLDRHVHRALSWLAREKRQEIIDEEAMWSVLRRIERPELSIWTKTRRVRVPYRFEGSRPTAWFSITIDATRPRRRATRKKARPAC